MANLYVNLPAPAGNGVGAAIDVAALGKRKSIVVESVAPAPFEQTVTIEASENAGFDFAPVVSFTEPDQKPVLVAARFMRARVSGFVSGLAQVDVGANDNAAKFASLPVPVGNGVGAAVATDDLGSFKSVVVGNPVGQNRFSGTVNIQVSEDATEFVDLLSFTKSDIQSRSAFASFMRTVRFGVDPDFLDAPIVDVGAINELVSAESAFPVSTMTTVTSVPSAVASVLILAANASRLGASIFNDSNNRLFLKLNPAAASAASYTVKVEAQDYFEVPFRYVGDITGIWAPNVSGAALVTEYTP